MSTISTTDQVIFDQSTTSESAATSTLPATISAVIVGALFIFAVGFSSMSAAHNAAHDTRHTVAFPCH